MKALVTGACGFAGSHLVELLSSVQGGRVDGTYRPPQERIPAVIQELLRPHTLEMGDAAGCAELLQTVRPTHVFHLAGPAHVGDSFTQAGQVASAILGGTANLLEAAAALPTPPRFLLVSSAEVYGATASVVEPLTEQAPPSPDSPYAVGKLAAEAYAGYAWRARGVPAVIARAFNHIGPRQSDRFAAPSFAHQIATAEAGGPTEIRVGNLAAERDLSDVRDIVRGYLLLAERGAPGEIYNLCSERSLPISRLLELLLAQSRVPLTVVRDPSRQRPVDVPRMRGSAAKARALGWAPQRELPDTLRDLLDSWR